MATQVLIAHTGQELQLDTSQFTTCVVLAPLRADVYANRGDCAVSMISRPPSRDRVLSRPSTSLL